MAVNSFEIGFISVMSAYIETRTSSGSSGRPVSQVQAAMSLVVKSGRDQTWRSGVARMAARGHGAAKTCVPGGRDSIFPLVVVAGSCKSAKREQRDHSIKHSAKFAVATLLFCRFSCFIKTWRSCWVGSEFNLEF